MPDLVDPAPMSTKNGTVPVAPICLTSDLKVLFASNPSKRIKISSCTMQKARKRTLARMDQLE
jgi:hypothetical protein